MVCPEFDSEVGLFLAVIIGAGFGTWGGTLRFATGHAAEDDTSFLPPSSVEEIFVLASLSEECIVVELVII